MISQIRATALWTIASLLLVAAMPAWAQSLTVENPKDSDKVAERLDRALAAAAKTESGVELAIYRLPIDRARAALVKASSARAQAMEDWVALCEADAREVSSLIAFLDRLPDPGDPAQTAAMQSRLLKNMASLGRINKAMQSLQSSAEAAPDRKELAARLDEEMTQNSSQLQSGLAQLASLLDDYRRDQQVRREKVSELRKTFETTRRLYLERLEMAKNRQQLWDAYYRTLSASLERRALEGDKGQANKKPQGDDHDRDQQKGTVREDHNF